MQSAWKRTIAVRVDDCRACKWRSLARHTSLCKRPHYYPDKRWLCSSRNPANLLEKFIRIARCTYSLQPRARHYQAKDARASHPTPHRNHTTLHYTTLHHTQALKHTHKHTLQMYYCKDPDCCKVAEAWMMLELEPELEPVEFYSEHELAKHVRKKHNADIRTTGASSDNHGHFWHCFSCKGKSGKDHRSFDSDQAVFDHLRTMHGLNVG